METTDSALTTPKTNSVGKRSWVMPVLAGFVVFAAVLAGACSSDPAEQIHGAWYWPEQGVYESLDEDGQWGVWLSGDLEGDPYDWGTYTFDGEVLTYHNAEGSVCSGATAVWRVAFSEDGDEAIQMFVEDSCSSVRGQDRVLTRHLP